MILIFLLFLASNLSSSSGNNIICKKRSKKSKMKSIYKDLGKLPYVFFELQSYVKVVYLYSTNF